MQIINVCLSYTGFVRRLVLLLYGVRKNSMPELVEMVGGTETRIIVQHLYRGADKSLARPGMKQATATKVLYLQAILKIIGKLSVQRGLRGSNDLRVGRKMVTFQLFFQSGLSKDLSEPLYVGGVSLPSQWLFKWDWLSSELKQNHCYILKSCITYQFRADGPTWGHRPRYIADDDAGETDLCAQKCQVSACLSLLPLSDRTIKSSSVSTDYE